MRMWALWRRVLYGLLYVTLGSGISFMLYIMYGYTIPTCFDGMQNGIEGGVDCGGGCVRICTADALPPKVLWVRPFRSTEGVYNVVAYVENRNMSAGVARFRYTVKLYDHDGMITEVESTTVLPPQSVYPVFEGRITTSDRVPTQAVIEFEDDPVWVPASAGREQFEIVRRELSGADSKPRLTATLRNTALEAAYNVEVVATIFDTQGTALNASRTVIPQIGGRSTEDVVFTWQEPIAKTLRSCEVPTDVVLAIDLSGSMNNDGGTPPEPLTSVLSAAESFIERLQEQDQAGLVTYGTSATIVSGLSHDHSTLSTTVRTLNISPEAEKGGTNIGEALFRSYEVLSATNHNPDARKVLVLFTDGLANEPDEDPEGYALNASGILKSANIEIFTIGLGVALNDAFLKSIATDQKYYFNAPTKQTVQSVYNSVTQALCEEGAAVIEIVPKSTASFSPLK